MRRRAVLTVLLLGACSRVSGGGVDTDAGGPDTDAGDVDAGPLSRALELTIGPGRLEQRELLFDGECFVALWAHLPAGETAFRVTLVRVAETGIVVSGPGVVLTLGGFAELRLRETDGGYTLFRRPIQGSGVVGALAIDDAGNPVGALRELESFSMASTERGLGVAASGGGYRLLTGEKETVSGAIRHHLKTRLFDRDLSPLGPSRLVDPGNEEQHDPFVAWLPGAAGGAGAFWMLWRGADRIRTVLIGAGDEPVGKPRVLLETGESQQAPRAALDEGGRALVSWKRSGRESPRFLLFDPLADREIWSRPAAWLPANRVAALDYDVAIRGDRALCAWQSDASTSVTEIRVGEIDLAGAAAPPPGVASVRTLSSPAHPAWGPRVAAGRQAFAVLFSSTVEGSERLYLRLVSTP